MLFPEEAYQEPSEAEWLYAAATNPAFDFLKEPTENIYTSADGRPFDDIIRREPGALSPRLQVEASTKLRDLFGL